MIDLSNVVRTYRKGRMPVHALRGAALHVSQGELLSVQGPSGSGKTTLLNLVGLLDEPTSGTIRVFEHDVSNLRPQERARLRGRSIGFVFQSFNLIPSLNAWQNVALPLRYAGVGRRERKERALQALATVGLRERADHHPAELSGGEEQRVAIARSLAVNPKLILADEPTGNLDSESGHAVMSQFRALHEAGRTILVVTHDPIVLSYTARHVTLRDGFIHTDEAASRS